MLPIQAVSEKQARISSVTNNGPNSSGIQRRKCHRAPPIGLSRKSPTDAISDFFGCLPNRPMAEIVQQFEPCMRDARSQDLGISRFDQNVVRAGRHQCGAMIRGRSR